MGQEAESLRPGDGVRSLDMTLDTGPGGALLPLLGGALLDRQLRELDRLRSALGGLPASAGVAASAKVAHSEALTVHCGLTNARKGLN